MFGFGSLHFVNQQCWTTALHNHALSLSGPEQLWQGARHLATDELPAGKNPKPKKELQTILALH